MLPMIADLAAATGITTANATIVVAAVKAGWTIFAIISAFSSFGLTSALLLATRGMATKRAALY